jgi:hypothetical protein
MAYYFLAFFLNGTTNFAFTAGAFAFTLGDLAFTETFNLAT